jgi:hypothetical protein
MDKARIALVKGENGVLGRLLEAVGMALRMDGAKTGRKDRHFSQPRFSLLLRDIAPFVQDYWHDNFSDGAILCGAAGRSAHSMQPAA